MINLLKTELIELKNLIQRHWTPIAIISFSILLIILVREKKPPVLPKLHLDGIPDQSLKSLVYWGLVPLIFGMLVTRKNPLKLGLGLGNFRYWIPVSLLFLVIALPIVYVSGSAGSFQNYYAANQNFDLSEYIWRMSLYMIGWEFFYRGFMTLGLKDSLKEGAILVQMIPFTLLHLGKPMAESIACIPSGLIWGYIAYKGESFWPAFFMHMAVNVVLKCASIGMI